MIKLTRQRDILRNKAPFGEHFISTMRKKPYGIWLNIECLRDLSEEDRYKLVFETFNWLNLND